MQLKKNTDALFNPDVVTYIETTHGKPIQFGYMGDTENVAALVSEGNLATEQDISSVGGVMIGALPSALPFSVLRSKHSKTLRWLVARSNYSRSSPPNGLRLALDLTS